MKTTLLAKDRPDLQIIKFHARPAQANVLWSVQNNDLGVPRNRYFNQWFIMIRQKHPREFVFLSRLRLASRI